MENKEKIIKKIGIDNFKILKELSEIIEDTSDGEKRKKLENIKKMIQENDKMLLKSFDIKFSESARKKIIEVMDLYS